MTLYLIGLGLHDEKDISVKGLETVKRCDKIYLENYTSILGCTAKDLEKFYGQKIVLASREMAEQSAEKIVNEAKKKTVAFLVVGDPFSATTHVELFRLAREKKVPVEVIHNASVLTAIGITGLQLYKFGRIASIPFRDDVPTLEAPYRILQQNYRAKMHTLFLLDLKPGQKFMTISEAMDRLEEIEMQKKEKIIADNLLVVACARLGSTDAIVHAGRWKEVKAFDVGKPPYCLIVPSAQLHFLEKEMLGSYNSKNKATN